ncbi:hypothetical protein E2C01_074271 [Portunus trituberculatus]|uniref:Uncharacterized protein n=1 Tax=Portunus trituberculatus TaxID=210409 RepID=A0A5B7IDV9_PORTR|nr:hypothetical protein [Portunus trituberculatus]
MDGLQRARPFTERICEVKDKVRFPKSVKVRLSSPILFSLDPLVLPHHHHHHHHYGTFPASHRDTFHHTCQPLTTCPLFHFTPSTPHINPPLLAHSYAPFYFSHHYPTTNILSFYLHLPFPFYSTSTIPHTFPITSQPHSPRKVLSTRRNRPKRLFFFFVFGPEMRGSVALLPPAPVLPPPARHLAALHLRGH